MSNKIIFLLVIAWLVAVSSVFGQTTELQQEDCVEGLIRIKLKESQLKSVNLLTTLSTEVEGSELGVPGIDQVSREVGIQRLRRVFPFSPKHEAKHREYGLHLWVELEFDPTIDPRSVADKYTGLSELEYAKPVYKKVSIDQDKKAVPYNIEVVSKNTTVKSAQSQDSYIPFFNDPLLIDQWHYESDGSIVENTVDIDLFGAWEQTSGNSDIIVAVVDEGVDVEHEDLKENIWNNEAEINGIEGVDDDQNGYIDDYHGYNFVMDGALSIGDHGTHVAGTVGAVSNNGIGVSGVAGGDGNGNGVKMISCQVFDNRSRNGGNFAAAIVYGADNGAVISQNSWGYNTTNYYEPEVLDAIRYFVAEAGQYEGSPMKGGVLFFAAGNEGLEDALRYPAAFDEVVAVTAFGPEGYPAPYSNRGEWADIAAPGGDATNYGEKAGILSTLPNDQYGYMEGTSMACPHVSGVAALVLSKFGGEDFTADDLTRIILNSTKRFTFVHEGKYGTGILNAVNALADDNRIPPDAISDLHASEIFHSEIRLEWTVPADEDNGEPRYYYLAIGSSEITEKNFDEFGYFVLENELSAGDTFNINITGFQKQSNYWFAVKSADQFDNISKISNILHVKTSDLPHFMESTRLVDVSIDVNSETIKKVPINFSNIGDGIIYWNTSIENETYYQETAEELQTQIDEKKAEAAANESDFSSTRSYALPYQSLKSATTVPDELEHWRNDDTQFKYGLSYENASGYPDNLMGSGNTNAGLIFATRFDIPYDYKFNMTHLAVALFPTIKDKPIIIELKKGSKRVEEAETVYLQEYYPDTTNVLKYFLMPVYRPQKFEDNEILWVVLHFPKEMAYPLAVQFGGNPDFFNYFLMSKNNGLTFQNAYFAFSRMVVPMLAALSTGDDGSYVFMNPNNGEIASKQTTTQEVVIDATNLTNGKHLASLGILTNDIHKPVVNIEVKVNVSGQQAEVENKEVYSFKAYNQRENKLEFEITNKGLADLEIYNISAVVDGVEKNFTDSVVIGPSFKSFIPFKYTPDNTGLIQTRLILETNIGTIELPTEFTVTESPELEISTVIDTIELAYNEIRKVDVQLKNNSSSTALEYDLSHYSIINSTNGILPYTFHYEILTSQDVGGPEDNQWEDISAYSNKYGNTDIKEATMDLAMKFPFFNEMPEIIYANLRGQLFLYYDGLLGNDPEADVYGFSKGLFIPIRIKDHYLKIRELQQYSFGDHSVFTVSADIIDPGQSGSVSVGIIDYQIVLFRDGAIEFRYKNLDAITEEMDYYVAIQGLTRAQLLMFKDFGSPNKLYSGQVIRFEPDAGINMIVSANSTEGLINTETSKNIELTINPEMVNAYEGIYNNPFVVKTNTVNGYEYYPLIIKVTGTPEILSVDSALFNPVKLGFASNSFAKITNLGTSEVTINYVSFSQAEFSSQLSLPLSIGANSKVHIPLTFTPSATGELTGTMNITFDNGTQKSVVLVANAFEDPSYTISVPDNIVVDLLAGEHKTVPLSLENLPKNIDLHSTFANNWFSWINAEGQKRGESTNSVDVDSKFGYWWGKSGEERPFYKWEDITDSSEVLIIEQGEQYMLPLPFEFPFFGKMYDTIWISKNGYVAVVEPESDDYRLDFEKGDGFAGVIAPFWSENLVPSIEGDGVRLRTEDSRVLLQWNQFQAVESSISPGKLTFQLEMQADGSIYFHYKKVSGWQGVLNYGLESPDEEETVETTRSWILDWSILSDKSSLAFIPPLRNKISSGENKNFDLEISAERIYKSGTYRDTVVLYSNSDSQSKYIIPVQVNVTGKPELSAPDTLNWGDVIFTQDLTLNETIKLKNPGSDPLTITSIKGEGLDDLLLYDSNGDKIIKNSSGTLLNPITINPWDEFVLKLEIPVKTQNDVNGMIRFAGDSETTNIRILAKPVDSPVFTWTATDQVFNANSDDIQEYQFSIKNDGPGILTYDLLPTIIPEGGDIELPLIVDKIGNFNTGQLASVREVALDTKEPADGVFTPMIEMGDLAFATRLTAPRGGFFLTHVRAFEYLTAVNEYLRLMVYLGGEDPTAGEKLYEQKYVIDRAIDQQWINIPLEQGIQIPEGEDFYIIIVQPPSFRYFGFELANDLDIVPRNFTGLIRPEDTFYWIKNEPPSDTRVWKMRAVTAAGDGAWLSLDNLGGEVNSGESVEIKAMVDAKLAGAGEHIAKVLATSNDVNRSSDEFNIELRVNGAPDFEYFPNIYKDTLRVTETEETVLNYLFKDNEGESMTFETGQFEDGIELTSNQTSNNTAQLTVNTNYESEGFYKIPVFVTDAAGNVSADTVLLEVENKNRPPVFNTDFENIELNLSDPNPFTIDPAELFTDPDGDEIQTYAGNYNPEIVDMAFGTVYIGLYPIMEGTAVLIFAADDGKENGFVYSYVYVQVFDDPDAVKASPYGNGNNPEIKLSSEQTMNIYPNPVTNGRTNLVFRLENDSNTRIEIYNATGIKVESVDLGYLTSGEYQRELELGGYVSGIYICRLIKDDESFEACKFVIN
ncbi:S8 family serine peptidase [Prolixibacteraceae bacterium Z1-6]|uniref:S8 family serine peptidase n=1 Tax=Draconibacterium aestuarii TaxID=2998507 RepID=A0A9X3J5I5_9BACT|nr:S8 family serine peptidase [Prolixibacteraceae bacterium Z1-6]